MGFNRLYIILTYASVLLVTGDRDCSWSRKTVMHVDSCPMNKTTLENRIREKGCEKYANLQNCTEPSKFLYHCAINEYGNATVEVCAPLYIINGFCAEYNIVGARIQPHHKLRCSDVNPPCAARYNSTDAYLYEGCFANVKNKGLTTFSPNYSTPTSETTSTVAQMTASENTQIEFQTVVFIVYLVVAVVIAVIFVIITRRKIGQMYTGSLYALSEESALTTENDKEKTANICQRADYETTISKGELLRDRVFRGETGIEEQIKVINERTKGYLESYEEVNRCFVKTRFLLKSKTVLKENGIAVLIGQQGSGKTSIAVNIMSDPDYKNWKKLKITSWEELLALSKTENDTLIYIDNLFDGFLYHRKLEEWWHSLCFFYFEFIKPRKTIHLLITAKEEEIKTSCSYIFGDKNTPENICFVREESNSLTDNEKKEILVSQINRAKGKTKIDQSFDIDKLVSETKGEERLIGFPLCAHMWALEKDNTLRDPIIFTNPRSYVIRQIRDEIKDDKENVVKTLLLTLLFTNSQNHPVDLMYGKQCEKFLAEKTSKEFIAKVQPLNFQEMHSKASDLLDVILIKNNNVFELKHQIYIEGVCEYFFRMHFEAVVQYFPMYILRNCEMHDVPKDDLETLKKRVKTEIEKQALSEIFSWRIFENQSFKQYICDELQKDEEVMQHLLSLPDKSSGFGYPASFWASKFHLPNLSKEIVKYAKRKKEANLQFYLAMFGECCAKNEKYITQATNKQDVGNLQSCVFTFKTSDAETILHLLLSSDMPDYDAHYSFTKILKESNLKVDESLLLCTLRQRKCSRLLCILEILDRQRVSLVEDKNHTASLVNELIRSFPKSRHLELECLCRICIFVVCGKIPFSKSVKDTFFSRKNACHEEDSQCVNDELQREMANRITEFCDDLPRSDAKIPRISKSMNPKLVKAIKVSVQILSKIEIL
nr:uncharacterized protein LOC111103658 isoform X3 [Crassostrea virginica]XP_022292784.1 uncharacterized protein LOC111103658 isoform X3 [Crassostrea virginica]